MKKEDILSIVPLLPAQQFMLSATLKGQPSTYVQQIMFKVREVDHHAVALALDKLANAYECLKSVVLHEGLRQPVLVSSKSIQPRFVKHRITQKEVQGLSESIRLAGFHFAKDPCARFDWIETTEETYLLVTYHHLMFDGWGRQKLLGDFILLLMSPLATVAPKTNKRWFEEWKKLDHAAALQAYQSYLLPMDDSATITPTGDQEGGFGTEVLNLDQPGLAAQARDLGLTLSEYLNFGWICFLERWTGKVNVQYGQVKQNGLMELAQNGFGLGIQTLPVQFKVDPDLSPRQMLGKFKDRERKISPFPFVDLTHDSFSHLSYNFLLAFENYPIERSLLQVGQRFELVQNHDFSEFPLSLAITPLQDDLRLEWHYHRLSHSEAQIRALSRGFGQFMMGFHTCMDTPLREVQVCPKPAAPHFPDPITADDFFFRAEQSFSKLGQTALYEDLCSYFARHDVRLIWHVGDKHPNSAVLMCAAWKNGVEVLTLNEKESPSFMASLLSKRKPDVMFGAEQVQGLPTLYLLGLLPQSLPEMPPVAKTGAIPSSGCLSICTSGSTGEPKVVRLSLANLLHFFRAWDEKLPWREQEVFGVVAHPAFDIGVAELIFPLYKGWQTVVFERGDWTDKTAIRTRSQSVTAMHLVPTLMDAWMDAMEGDSVPRLLMTGGDKVPQSLSKRLHGKFPSARLFQFYGPSECSVLSTGFENRGQYPSDSLPIGDAFSHASMMVKLENGQPAPPFQEGEIMVMGPAVGLGYAEPSQNSPFIQHHGLPAYLTGDLGFADEAGFMFFRGRKDAQIKINGQRIELSRIERALSEWSGVAVWVVLFHQNFLFAFGKSESTTKLPSLSLLHDLLPMYAVPHFLELMEGFPVNKNGKVDMGQLKLRADHLVENMRDAELPEEVAKLLAETFPNKSINPSLNWYAQGLNSIDAMRFSGALLKYLNLQVPFKHIIQSVNLASIPFHSNQPKIPSLEPIAPGTEVHSTAARLLFLSESDETFAKTFWISSGFQIPPPHKPAWIEQWFKAQSALHLCVKPHESSYQWQQSATHILKRSGIQKDDFLQWVQGTYLQPEEGLMMVFISDQGPEKPIFLAIKVHHALLDGLGVEDLWHDFLNDYQAETVTTLSLTAPEEQPVETEFWRNYLQGVRVSELPFQRKNAVMPLGKRWTKELSHEESGAIQSLCSTLHCSAFEAGLILWTNLWHRFFPSGDFATGIPVSAREHSLSGNLQAMSVNLLPFRVQTDKKEEILAAWRNVFSKRNQPFAEIARLDQSESKTGQPFFNTSYLYHAVDGTDHGVEALDFGRDWAEFPVSLDFMETDGKRVFSWEYRADLFSEKAIHTLHEIFFQGLPIEKVQTASSPGLDLMAEWQKVVAKWGSKPAIVHEKGVWTYTELDEQIRNRMDYNPPVGIELLTLERQPDSLAMILACLLQKRPFLPVASETPLDRIQTIQSLLSASNPDINPEGGDLAYVIATSGTTGAPKLVGVRRLGYEAAVIAWREEYNITDQDVLLQAASFSFDVSLGDVGRCFFNGGTLVLLGKEGRQDPSAMLEVISKHKVTLFETTPVVLRWWLEDGFELSRCPDLRLLIVGSDSWKMREMRRIAQTKLSHQKIISSYGLSETTIDNSFFDIDKDDSDSYEAEMTVPIGRPMGHGGMTIGTETGKPLPDGLEGKISFDGPAVGLGYVIDGVWSNPQAVRWTSADRGMRDEFGVFHFKGRSDRQVKIRGQRVELEEVERMLGQICSDRQWVVVDFQNQLSTEMAAFHTKPLSAEEKSSLRKSIVEHYPAYFLPSGFIEVETFPLNQNGKVDLKPLRVLAEKKLQIEAIATSGQTTLAKLLSHFQQLFKEEINPEAGFFSTGKNSFEAMQFVRTWNASNPEKMAVHQLFSASTMQGLAQVLVPVSSESIGNTSNQAISKAQEAIWFEIKQGKSTLYNLPHLIEIPHSMDQDRCEEAFEKTLKRQEALFVRFEEDAHGNVFQVPVSSEGFRLIQKKVDDLDAAYRNESLKPIDFSKGPCFHAEVWMQAERSFLFFCPHHLVYDGGSDAPLLEEFMAAYEGKPVSIQPQTSHSKTEKIDWNTYFHLAKPPTVWFEKVNHELQPSLNFRIAPDSWELFGTASKQQSCTLSVVLSYVLGRALDQVGFRMNWLSMVVDLRHSDSVGMHMRAFPFPCLRSDIPAQDFLAQQQWALSQLFKAADQPVIYPEGVVQSAYHQIGLVIQHPFHLEDAPPSAQTSWSRPRLPLTLYVEESNHGVNFRWEFDHHCMQESVVQDLHRLVLEEVKLLQNLPKTTSPFSPVSPEDHFSSVDGVQDPVLEAIWCQYVGSEASSGHFFEAGGNSIKALLLLRDIEKKTGQKISASSFFKQPTLAFLQRCLQEPKPDQSIWQIQSGKEGREIWLFPPIMGMGLIYNSLRLPSDLRALAFHYPETNGDNSCTSIEEIALTLMRARESMGHMPQEVVLLGYSMGGLVAFETAKWLETKGIRTVKLVVLDKTAQPEPGMDMDQVQLKSELLDIVQQIAPDENEAQTMRRYLEKHERMIEKYQQSGCIKCPVEVFHCLNGFKLEDFQNWNRFTIGKVSLHPIVGVSHYGIPKIWNELPLGLG